MAIGNDVTSFDDLLKEYYSEGFVDETYEKKPLWAMMTKSRDRASVTGKTFIHPVIITQGQGRSTSFSIAQANSKLTGTVPYDFAVTRLNNYQLATLQTELLLASANDRGAFVKAVTQITDGALKNLGNDQEISMFGDGSGVRGNISAGTTIASPTLQLAIAGGSVYFEVGMELQLASSASATPRAFGSAGHGLYVIAVDRNSGTLTIGSTPNPNTATPVDINDAAAGIPTAAVGDFIFCRGDQGNKMSGLSAWIPYGGPSSTPFYGVDRTVDPVRLAGNWLDGTQSSIEEALMDAATQVAEQGYEIDTVFMSFQKYNQLQKSLSSKVMITKEVTPDIGFEGMRLLSSTGPVDIIPARNCPKNRMFGLKMDSWEYIHLADPIQVFNYDGATWLRLNDQDAMEARFFSLGNVVCNIPAANIVIGVNP